MPHICIIDIKQLYDANSTSNTLLALKYRIVPQQLDAYVAIMIMKHTYIIGDTSLCPCRRCLYLFSEAEWRIYASVTYTIIGSNNGLSPGRRRAIILANVGILLIGPLGTNFSEILIETHARAHARTHAHTRTTAHTYRQYTVICCIYQYHYMTTM